MTTRKDNKRKSVKPTKVILLLAAIIIGYMFMVMIGIPDGKGGENDLHPSGPGSYISKDGSFTPPMSFGGGSSSGGSDYEDEYNFTDEDDYIDEFTGTTGYLYIFSDPDNAVCYLDDEEIGRTSTDEWLVLQRESGSYNLKIEKDGYGPWEQNINVEANEQTIINARLSTSDTEDYYESSDTGFESETYREGSIEFVAASWSHAGDTCNNKVVVILRPLDGWTGNYRIEVRKASNNAPDKPITSRSGAIKDNKQIREDIEFCAKTGDKIFLRIDNDLNPEALTSQTDKDYILDETSESKRIAMNIQVTIESSGSDESTGRAEDRGEYVGPPKEGTIYFKKAIWNVGLGNNPPSVDIILSTKNDFTGEARIDVFEDLTLKSDRLVYRTYHDFRNSNGDKRCNVPILNVDTGDKVFFRIDNDKVYETNGKDNDGYILNIKSTSERTNKGIQIIIPSSEGTGPQLGDDPTHKEITKTKFPTVFKFQWYQLGDNRPLSNLPPNTICKVKISYINEILRDGTNTKYDGPMYIQIKNNRAYRRDTLLDYGGGMIVVDSTMGTQTMELTFRTPSSGSVFVRVDNDRGTSSGDNRYIYDEDESQRKSQGAEVRIR